MSVESNKALASSGAFAPANLNSFTADPMAGMYHRSAAVEPYLYVRVATVTPTPITLPTDSLAELLMRVTEENRHAEVDFGSPVGNEEW